MSDKVWDYRVVRSKEYHPSDDNSIAGHEEWLSIQEIYYGDDENPVAQTIDLQVEGKNIPELREQLQVMLWCLDKEIVDEIESDVSSKTMEDRVLSLEMENAEMRVKLTELNDIIKDTPNNMELGSKVRSL